MVSALRHVDLSARALRGRVPRARAPVARGQVPARGQGGRGARRLDDHSVDAAGERRGGGPARRRVRAP